tara:strand:+ start:302 stop:427 length:126 start_codon:yes stop_codon:yes gene_type:complete
MAINTLMKMKRSDMIFSFLKFSEYSLRKQGAIPALKNIFEY